MPAFQQASCITWYVADVMEARAWHVRWTLRPKWDEARKSPLKGRLHPVWPCCARQRSFHQAACGFPCRAGCTRRSARALSVLWSRYSKRFDPLISSMIFLITGFKVGSSFLTTAHTISQLTPKYAWAIRSLIFAMLLQGTSLYFCLIWRGTFLDASPI